MNPSVKEVSRGVKDDLGEMIPKQINAMHKLPNSIISQGNYSLF